MLTRKPTTSNAPVILLNDNVELITGIRLVSSSYFVLIFVQILLLEELLLK